MNDAGWQLKTVFNAIWENDGYLVDACIIVIDILCASTTRTQESESYMKLHYLIMGALLLAILTACEQKITITTEKVADKVNDALDRRPNEKIRDAVEDAGDAVKDASKEIQKSLEAVTEEMKK